MVALSICGYYTDLCTKKVSLLDFTRQIVLALLATADMPSKNSVCPKTKKQVLDATRLDGKDHLVNKNATDTQRRCVLLVVNAPNLSVSNAMWGCTSITVLLHIINKCHLLLL